MSIVSPLFLFLFLPMAVGIYFVLPKGGNLLFRNLFLLFFSLVFYAWGEPVFIFLLLILIVLTWLLGKMAEGRQNTKTGNLAVFLTVVMNVGTLLFLGKIRSFFGFPASSAGVLSPLPAGFAFFAFHSISYVVDIYRGQCKAASKLLDAALYLSVFFKILQGPIISYRDFKPQIESRETSMDDFCRGIRRLAIGLGKKMIIAANLVNVTKIIFASDFSSLSLADAWIGCGVFMIVLYYDFSGYSDMAIGLARIFGFKMPENFNYPYVSTSVGEYWRRWHITLCAWFRDYLYFPIVLGPSVSFRKFLLRHHVDDRTAKTLQNIFVPSCVWLVTALWHGTNWNYTIWGMLNSSAMIVEPHLKPLKNKRMDKLIRWLAVMLILLLSVPLFCTGSLARAALFFRAMFAGTGIFAVSGSVRFYLSGCWCLLLIGTAGSFMLFPLLKKKLYPQKSLRLQAFWDWGETVFLFAVTVLALGFLFRDGNVTFMYQQ